MGRPKKITTTRTKALRKFGYQRKRQLKHGWEITFEEWDAFWLSHGVDKNQDSGYMTPDTLCLRRHDDTKPFSLSNIYASTQRSTRGHKRPSVWKVKDPIQHEKYMPFLRARSQAWFREELWELEWEDWLKLWPDELWTMRGRTKGSMCLTRYDPTDAWNLSNCLVTTRGKQLLMAHQYRSQLPGYVHPRQGKGKSRSK